VEDGVGCCEDVIKWYFPALFIAKTYSAGNCHDNYKTRIEEPLVFVDLQFQSIIIINKKGNQIGKSQHHNNQRIDFDDKASPISIILQPRNTAHTITHISFILTLQLNLIFLFNFQSNFCWISGIECSLSIYLLFLNL